MVTMYFSFQFSKIPDRLEGLDSFNSAKDKLTLVARRDTLQRVDMHVGIQSDEVAKETFYPKGERSSDRIAEQRQQQSPTPVALPPEANHYKRFFVPTERDSMYFNFLS